MWDDGNSLGPKEVHSYLTRMMYNRRNKFNPLWNSFILGGVKNGQKYLGMVRMIGVNFEDNHVATGFGNHLARPILRDEWHENLSFEDGVKLLEKCMRVLLYRDRSAVNKLQVCCFLTSFIMISFSPSEYMDFVSNNSCEDEGGEQFLKGNQGYLSMDDLDRQYWPSQNNHSETDRGEALTTVRFNSGMRGLGFTAPESPGANRGMCEQVGRQKWGRRKSGFGGK
ncbi:proteasome subunit beta type-4-like [Juglans regia]|uniref:Proteasome subunit beta type-4-like n=1 Tax=Juglans regia TaxID=51240 RepID=A0A6P9EPX1_JUGRE|nr:proteasome subunit beta type-4-like [Juglans regia]